MYALSAVMADAVKDHDTALGENDYDPLLFASDIPKFDFAELSKSFVRDYYGADARKFREARPILKTGSTYEIFEVLWDNEEAHEFLIPNFLIPEETLKVKDEKKAFTYFLLGVKNRNKEDSALKYFNASIIFASHPPVEIDGKTFYAPDTNSGERRRESLPGWGEWGRYELLNRATLGRAEVLYRMGHYKACIEDLEFILQGCPVNAEEHLYCLKSCCYQKLLTAGGYQHYYYNSFSFRSAPLPPGDMDHNPYLKAASAAVELVHIDGGDKRCLQTNRNVNQGKTPANKL